MDEKAKYPKIRKVLVTTKTELLVPANVKRKFFMVYNNGTANVELLSGADQKYGDGIPIAPGVSYENTKSYGAYWIVAASDTQDVRLEEDSD